MVGLLLKCLACYPPSVILSTFAALRVNSAKDLSRWATRCFAAAQHDSRLDTAHGGSRISKYLLIHYVLTPPVIGDEGIMNEAP
jgi:hypothetical protein